MTKMRAKFKIVEIVQAEGSERLKLTAVGGTYDANGVSEDNSFARWTPSGELGMTITNPDLLGTFKCGQKFYLDFTPAVDDEKKAS